jgi:hypothetical protein
VSDAAQTHVDTIRAGLSRSFWTSQRTEALAALDALVADRDRLRGVLGEIADPSYVGNYSDAEVVDIYRKWATYALG